MRSSTLSASRDTARIVAFAMALYHIEQFEVRADARDAAERAMHDYATYVRAELPDSSWTTYRDPHRPTRYMAIMRSTTAVAEERQRSAPGTHAFTTALRDLLAGAVDTAYYELVTSSDLAPRHRERGPGGRRRPR
jgi:hypothetical protein